MSARDEIFGAIRRSLGATGREAPRREIVSERLAHHPSGVIPARTAGKGAAELLSLFVEMAEASAATVSVVARAEDAPAAIADFLRGRNMALRLRRGDDPRLARLDWAGAAIDADIGRSFGQDETAASFAFAGVAETGTLVLLSGRENPTTLNFLPDLHVVLIEAAEVEATYEDVWKRVRERFGPGVMPRTVNFITGPSRSADIEQILLMGAHGPRRLHIVLIDPAHQSNAPETTAVEPVGSTPGGQKTTKDEPTPGDSEAERERKREDAELDEELEESFPASDPPSSTQP